MRTFPQVLLFLWVRVEPQIFSALALRGTPVVNELIAREEVYRALKRYILTAV